MRILVSIARRHGSTTETAARTAETIRAGLPDDTVVDVRPADDPVEVASYDAVVIGSAVYMGHWLDDARHAATTIAAVAPRPVWLFSSGPIGDPPKPDDEPAGTGDLVTTTQARGHKMFTGRLDRHQLGFAEKAMLLALRAPDGDFREWAAIDAWAAEIAEELSALSVAARPSVPSLTKERST